MRADAGVGGRGPAEGLRVGVVSIEIGADGLVQLDDGAANIAPDDASAGRNQGFALINSKSWSLSKVDRSGMERSRSMWKWRFRKLQAKLLPEPE